MTSLRQQVDNTQVNQLETATLVRGIATSNAKYGRAARVALAAATWCTGEVKKRQNAKAARELL
eukprot:5205715-Alexandrium_andersonii.AAC.1